MLRIGRTIPIFMLTLAACAPSPITVPPASAGSPGQTAGLTVARALDSDARLTAAFVANVADVASWQAHGYGLGTITITTSSSAKAPLDRVDVCYFDGAFNVGGHPNASTARAYERLLVLVSADGDAGIATAGFGDTMPLASPPHGP
jgi:hypothetical protein